MWYEFWDEFVPMATKGEPYSVVMNGDAMDGVHHGSTTQWSHNLTDQCKAAEKLLKPIVAKCDGRYYHIRGTEAHVGKSSENEEMLAKNLCAIQNEDGQFARYDLWIRVDGRKVHLLHHIGSTGSQAYEATALCKEITETLIEAARWGRQPPDMIVRSHRHRAYKITMPSAVGSITGVITGCWQGKTPFVWKIPGARLSTPQFGGVVIRAAHGEFFCREFVKTVEPSKLEE